MKKLLLLLCLCLLALPAFAEEVWIEAQLSEIVPPGVEAQADTQVYALALPDGREARSLCLTAEGNLRFGRYAQIVRTGLIDAETGEEIGLEQIFPDLDALRAFLDAYVEENVLEELNTYLDASDLLPVPLDAVSFDAQGITFHYPSERFMFFSGHAGAVQLQWYELRDLMAVSELGAPLPLEPGGSVEELLETYASLTDPDLVTGGELYEFEAPVLRGAQAVADENGTVIAVRFARFEAEGVTPGMAREQAEALLGAPEAAVILDADTAQYLRVPPGARAEYGDTRLYYDEDGTLRLLERVQK